MEMLQEVQEKLIERTAEVFRKDPSELSADTNFIEDLGAKSVNMVKIITVLEDVFDVEIPYMQVRRCKTIGEVAELVAELCEY